MKYKKSIFILILIACIFLSISSICASESNSTDIIGEDDGQILEVDNQSLRDDDSEISLENDNEQESMDSNGEDLISNQQVNEVFDASDTEISDDAILSKSDDEIKGYNIAIGWDFEVIKTPKSYGDREVIFKVVNSEDRTPISNAVVNFYLGNSHSTAKANSDGEVKYTSPAVYGKQEILLTLEDYYDSVNGDHISYDYDNGDRGFNAYLRFSIGGTDIPTKLTTSYPSGKYFQAKLVDYKFNKPLKNIKLLLKIYTGKKFKTVTLTTNSKGIAKYALYKLSVGKHKLVVSIKDTKHFKANSKNSKVTISKPALKVSAPKIRNVYKRGVFKVTVKNKKFGNPMKKVLVKIKVYTGKKFKTYKVKTNSKGIASIKTKSLKKGSHKVVISIKGNSKHKSASAKSKITIVKSKIKTNLCLEGPNKQILDYVYVGGVFANAIKVYPKLTANGKVLSKKITVKTSNGKKITGQSGKGIVISSSDYNSGKMTFVFAEDNYYCGAKYEYTYSGSL